MVKRLRSTVSTLDVSELPCVVVSLVGAVTTVGRSRASSRMARGTSAEAANEDSIPGPMDGAY